MKPLMQYSHGAGCGCKMAASDLKNLLKNIKQPKLKKQSGYPKIIRGFETYDDASVILINKDTAIVNTVDFFTPILNDPYRFGETAAANALSDVYAMGAEPISALSVSAFSIETLGHKIIQKILQGAVDKCAEAGIQILGGHSIEDNEPKFGLSVTGIADPQKIWLNEGAKPGDILILTKPLGTGIATTAVKKDLCPAPLEEAVYKSMSSLNKNAKDALYEIGNAVHSVTDITGFGLAGHLFEMMKASKTRAAINMKELKVFEGTEKLLEQNIYPGGTNKNKKYVENFIHFKTNNKLAPYIVFDPQTSGGLLAAINPYALNDLKLKIKEKNIKDFQIIGEVLPAEKNNKEKIIIEII
ncbi:MAG: selenide, water dikinase SelD [Spirochaetia bacterium]|nr:selenide, water dikinase SelD [Spirochaetia bacterium]